MSTCWEQAIFAFFCVNGVAFTGYKIKAGSSIMPELHPSGTIALQKEVISMTSQKFFQLYDGYYV